MSADEVLVDTSILIHRIVPEDRGAVISAVSLAELEHGIVAAMIRGEAAEVRARTGTLADVKAHFGDGLPFTGAAAAAYGRVTESALRNGFSPRRADTLIAATALHHGLALMTTDRRLAAFDPALEVIVVEPQR